MTTPGVIAELHFLKNANLSYERENIKNYQREIIHAYGIDATYYMSNFAANYFGDTPIEDIFGEFGALDYSIKKNIRVKIEIDQDSVALSKFGIELDSDGMMYILKEDFEELFRSSIGETVTEEVELTVNVNTLNEDTVTVEYSNNYFSGIAEQSVVDVVNNNFIFSSTINPIDNTHHDNIYLSSVYSDRVITGTLNGQLTLNGDIISGTVVGTITYHIPPTDNRNGVDWKIAPRVGDFVRIQFDAENYREYEITRVLDEELIDGGLNPLLGRYIWGCKIVRRQPSHELVSADTVNKEENWTATSLEYNPIEDISNDIFDYENETPDTNSRFGPDNESNMDSVFGDYDVGD